MPDTLSEYAAGASAAFDAPIVAIRPTDARFDQFNGIKVGRVNYINVNADTSPIYTACTKLKPMGIRAASIVRLMLEQRRYKEVDSKLLAKC